MATRWFLAIPTLLVLALALALPAHAESAEVLGQSVDVTMGVDPTLEASLAVPLLDERLHAQLSRDTLRGASASAPAPVSPWLDPRLWPESEPEQRPETKRTYEQTPEARCTYAGPVELRLAFVPIRCPLDILHAQGALPYPVLPRETSPGERLQAEVAAAPAQGGAADGFAFPAGEASAMAAALAGVAAVAAAGSAATSTAAAPLWERARRLAWLLGAPLYTRLRRDSLLDHGARDALFNRLKEQPGTAISDLSKTTGIPRNTVTHHLHMMERQGFVTSLRKGRVRLFFPAGSAVQKRNADALAVLRHETTSALARAIGERPGLDQAALCERFDLAPSLAHWHVRRLVENELVLQVRDGRHVRYYPGDSFHTVMNEGSGAGSANGA